MTMVIVRVHTTDGQTFSSSMPSSDVATLTEEEKSQALQRLLSEQPGIDSTKVDQITYEERPSPGETPGPVARNAAARLFTPGGAVSVMQPTAPATTAPATPPPPPAAAPTPAVSTPPPPPRPEGLPDDLAGTGQTWVRAEPSPSQGFENPEDYDYWRAEEDGTLAKSRKGECSPSQISWDDGVNWFPLPPPAPRAEPAPRAAEPASPPATPDRPVSRRQRHSPPRVPAAPPGRRGTAY